jgi:hypothetical protein
MPSAAQPYLLKNKNFFILCRVSLIGFPKLIAIRQNESTKRTEKVVVSKQRSIKLDKLKNQPLGGGAARRLEKGVKHT